VGSGRIIDPGPYLQDVTAGHLLTPRPGLILLPVKDKADAQHRRPSRRVSLTWTLPPLNSFHCPFQRIVATGWFRRDEPIGNLPICPLSGGWAAL